MYRLVHIASVSWLHRHSEQTTWADKAVDRLEKPVSLGRQKGKAISTPNFLYAMYMARLGDKEDTARARLLGRVGWCRTILGQYPIAKAKHEQT